MIKFILFTYAILCLLWVGLIALTSLFVGSLAPLPIWLMGPVGFPILALVCLGIYKLLGWASDRWI